MPFAAIDVCLALHAAHPRATKQRRDAIGIVGAGPSARALVSARPRRRDGQLPGRVQLFRLRARRFSTHLTRDTIAIRHALIATLVVHAAHLAARAITVVATAELCPELTDVKRLVAGHAALAIRTIATLRTCVVTTLKRAHQRRITIRVERAPLRERALHRIARTTSEQPQRPEQRAASRTPRQQNKHAPSVDETPSRVN